MGNMPFFFCNSDTLLPSSDAEQAAEVDMDTLLAVVGRDHALVGTVGSAQEELDSPEEVEHNLQLEVVRLDGPPCLDVSTLRWKAEWLAAEAK